ncbi:hypothetical protein HDU93_009666 [Gonapodya sp. JEL0774]|nr:hypothetical protein HDU93_009666 [Gonapodya sp. JEL0774]
MSKKAYTSGVVIIKCPGCTKNHLIADHLGWYDSQKTVGTLEDIMARAGRSNEIRSVTVGVVPGGQSTAVTREKDGANDGASMVNALAGAVFHEEMQGTLELLPEDILEQERELIAKASRNRSSPGYAEVSKSVYGTWSASSSSCLSSTD